MAEPLMAIHFRFVQSCITYYYYDYAGLLMCAIFDKSPVLRLRTCEPRALTLSHSLDGMEAHCRGNGEWDRDGERVMRFPNEKRMAPTKRKQELHHHYITVRIVRSQCSRRNRNSKRIIIKICNILAGWLAGTHTGHNEEWQWQ